MKRFALLTTRFVLLSVICHGVEANEYHQIPVGDWPKDPKLREVGKFVRACLENDIEGYTLMMWQDVLQWPKEEYQMFLLSIRKAIKNPKIHTYMKVRYVYGRKPEEK